MKKTVQYTQVRRGAIFTSKCTRNWRPGSTTLPHTLYLDLRGKVQGKGKAKKGKMKGEQRK